MRKNKAHSMGHFSLHFPPFFIALSLLSRIAPKMRLAECVKEKKSVRHTHPLRLKDYFVCDARRRKKEQKEQRRETLRLVAKVI